jgi:dTDP-4-amino-4,6-dideoxygalactose transaminase
VNTSSAEPGGADVPFHRVDVAAEDVDAVVETLRSGWLTSGPRVRELESWLTQRDGVQAVAMASCTHALEGALAAARLAPRAEVLTPSLTFTATTAAVVRAGARPDWVDIDPSSGLLTPDRVADAIGPDTAVVLSVDYGGLPVDYAGLRALCDERNLLFISDAAHSFGATVDDHVFAPMTDATCYSFYATKNLAGGEGGALLSAHPSWLEFARAWRMHGMSAGAEDRYRGGSSAYDIEMLGEKANMTDLTAALVLSQGRRERALRDRRRAIAHHYLSELADMTSLCLPVSEPGHAWHLFVVRVDADRRSAFVAELRARGIGTSVHFRPVHEMSYWRKRNLQRRSLAATEEWGASCVSLPIFPAMSDGEVERVVEATRQAAIERH